MNLPLCLCCFMPSIKYQRGFWILHNSVFQTLCFVTGVLKNSILIQSAMNAIIKFHFNFYSTHCFLLFLLFLNNFIILFIVKDIIFNAFYFPSNVTIDILIIKKNNLCKSQMMTFVQWCRIFHVAIVCMWNWLNFPSLAYSIEGEIWNNYTTNITQHPQS